jgi:rhamnosyl/mannosyltransferase
VVPLGISCERLSAEDRKEGDRIRAEYPDRPIILFVGRFRWYKGLNILLEAMDEVDATLLVVGSGTTAQVKETRRIAAGLRHPDRVRFLGTVSRLEPILAAGDLFCLPSTHRAEAFGYVLLEAFRAGLPAVTTELGTGTSYVNQDGVTGYVASPQDPKALADALNKAVTDQVHLRDLGIAARKRVEKEFGLEKMVEDILESYSSTSPASGHRP